MHITTVSYILIAHKPMFTKHARIMNIQALQLAYLQITGARYYKFHTFLHVSIIPNSAR